MAAAGGKGLAGTPLLLAGAALALLGVLVYLGALCAACRRKGRKKKIPPDGVKLVDESLLRQTQLRSLSRSDTKLHELSRLKNRDDTQRPASLGVPCPAATPPHSSGLAILLHRELPRIPVPDPPAAPQAPDRTYSNLLFTPLRKPLPDSVYECLAGGLEDAPVTPAPPGTRVSPPRGRAGGADYARVHKVKKVVAVELRDGAAVGPPATLRCWEGAGNAPRAKLEEMYSTVCKATKKKTQVPTREVGAGCPPTRQEEGAPAKQWPQAAQAPPDSCYESINDRTWTAQGRGPDPDYEAVDMNWKKAAGREKVGGPPSAPENLYESVGDIWAGGARRASARTAANGLEVYITNL
ncbi:lck-interacting transmembrane adapter 1 [Phaethornis superciliosus]